MRRTSNWFEGVKTKEDWLKVYNDAKADCLKCWNDHGRVWDARDGTCVFGICCTQIRISRSKAELEKYLPFPPYDNVGGASGYHIQMIQALEITRKILKEAEPLKQKADSLLDQARSITDELSYDSI